MGPDVTNNSTETIDILWFDYTNLDLVSEPLGEDHPIYDIPFVARTNFGDGGALQYRFLVYTDTVVTFTGTENPELGFGAYFHPELLLELNNDQETFLNNIGDISSLDRDHEYGFTYFRQSLRPDDSFLVNRETNIKEARDIWAIPEPGTIALMGLGLTSLAVFRRKFGKSSNH
jgi:hypothetical protein